MTTERRRAANRANAAHSTGPRSRRGKQIASRNAHKHGLTTPPAPAEVLRWGRILLGDPQATPADLDAKGPEWRALAEAEARCERAWTAERACVTELVRKLKARGENDPTKVPLGDFDNPEFLELLLSDPPEKLDKQLVRILLSISRRKISKLGNQLRIIQRYVTQAERAQARAFADWIAVRKNAG
jgi:hypothetical protein